MSDQKRMLSEAHKGWTRVWDLLAGKLPGYMSYEYIQTLNDTHIFRRIGTTDKWAHVTVQDGDFDVLPGVIDPSDDARLSVAPRPIPPPTMVEKVLEEIAKEQQPPPFDFAEYYGTK